MSIFDHQRLDNSTFKLDVERMRLGWYSDKYFTNISTMLTALAKHGYTYSGNHPQLPPGVSPEGLLVGDIEVEMQWFTRRPGKTIVAGVDKALTMLSHCTGYFEDGNFCRYVRSSASLGCPGWRDRDLGWQPAAYFSGDARARALP